MDGSSGQDCMTGSECEGFGMSTLCRSQIMALLLLSSSAMSMQAADVTLRSQKHAITIYVRVPPGWEGGSLKAWPSYETWSFAKTNGKHISYLQVRIDPITGRELDWNLATKEQIKKTFYDFSNPQIERIARTRIADTEVVVWAAFNVDGQLLMAELRRGKLKISFELRTEQRGDLRKFQTDFLYVLKNVRIVAKD
jgi:hypothetical protein